MPNRRLYAPHETINLKRLREIRRAKGFTIAAIAKAMGISPSNYRFIETGRNNALLYQFRQLCILLDINPLDICELLRLPILNRQLIRRFNSACKRLGQSPNQALQDFMLTFSEIASKETKS
ncbi:MAG: helix-turn-helix transcriptional regulator [Candidatus Methanomethylicaceae archaeon]